MNNDSLSETLRRIAGVISGLIETYPQISEEEPGGYCTERDQILGSCVEELMHLADSEFDQSEISTLFGKPHDITVLQKSNPYTENITIGGPCGLCGRPNIEHGNGNCPESTVSYSLINSRYESDQNSVTSQKDPEISASKTKYHDWQFVDFRYKCACGVFLSAENFQDTCSL